MAFFAEALQAVGGQAAGVEDGDDVEDAGAGGEAHGGHDVGAVADPDLVRDAGGDGVVAQALVAGDRDARRPQLGDRLPGDDGAAAAVGGAARRLQREALAQGADAGRLS